MYMHMVYRTCINVIKFERNCRKNEHEFKYCRPVLLQALHTESFRQLTYRIPHDPGHCMVFRVWGHEGFPDKMES